MAERIMRKDWVSSFTLIGRPRISEDHTFKIDQRSERSNWVYNSMNLNIDCGEKAGNIFADLMGGYSEGSDNKIFAHGKDDNGRDDFDKQIIVDFEDRFNDDVLEEIGDMSFFVCGLEKTSKGDVYRKNFLSAYDAIAYIREHLTEDMVVSVRGNLRYSMYNDVVQVRKNITGISLALDWNTKEFLTPDKYKATFTQTVLIDKDSASLKNIDKNKGIMYVDTKVLDYVKEINGVEVKGQYPYNKQFEFEMNFSDEAKCKKIMEKLFKVKKGYTQITFDGNFVESGAVVQATRDDLPQDILDLIDMGIYSESEALAKCAANGNRQRRMVLKAPNIRMVGDEDNKVPVLQVFPERYTEDDLILDCLSKNSDSNYPEDDDTPFDTDENSDDGLDWLSKL